MNLVPPWIAAAYQNGDAAAMEKLGVMTCMECGCCSFSCPASRQIVQTMRMAKGEVRKAHTPKTAEKEPAKEKTAVNK
jgi:electron transport complex protein RnfC